MTFEEWGNKTFPGWVNIEKAEKIRMEMAWEAALQSANSGYAAALECIPKNWLDPLLTGAGAALCGNGGTWGCPDIERLLNGIRERIQRLNAEANKK